MYEPRRDDGSPKRKAAQPSEALLRKCAFLPQQDGPYGHQARRHPWRGGHLQAAFHHQARPARRISVRPSGCASERDTPHPCIVGHDGQAGCRHLHAGRPRQLGRVRGARAGCGRHRSWRRRSGGLWLRPLHRRLGRTRRRFEAWCRAAASIGWKFRKADHADEGPRYDVPLLHSIVRTALGRSHRTQQGCQARRPETARGLLRCRTLDVGHPPRIGEKAAHQGH